MTLGNMRELGVRSLFVTCELCHHVAVLPADRWGDVMLVSAFRPRMVCTRCGIVGADARAATHLTCMSLGQSPNRISLLLFPKFQ